MKRSTARSGAWMSGILKPDNRLAWPKRTHMAARPRKPSRQSMRAVFIASPGKAVHSAARIGAASSGDTDGPRHSQRRKGAARSRDHVDKLINLVRLAGNCPGTNWETALHMCISEIIASALL